MTSSTARELADAIAAAVADDPQVEACRERRSAGFEMKVTLEAVVGFVNRTNTTGENRRGDGQGAGAGQVVAARRAFDMTANDRRFLRSLRIAAMSRRKKKSNN